MSNPIIKILDVSTGEQIEREMNANEFDKYQTDLANQEAQKAELEAKEAARRSALDKLAALGLSPEEISAITGA